MEEKKMLGKFEQIVAFLRNAKGEEEILIKGEQRKLKAGKSYQTRNLGEEGAYLKISFEDGSLLLVLLGEKMLMFTEEIVGHITEIKDEEIGRKAEVNYLGRKYNLVNKNDYQLVREKLFGEIDGVEGEVRFSDYESTELEGKRSELLSLGWLSESGKRADVWMVEVFEEEIGL